VRRQFPAMVERLSESKRRRLTAMLLSNARQSTADLARALGVARSTVHQRITKLEQEGSIVGYTTLLSPPVAERWTKAIMLLAIRQSETERVVEEIRSVPEVKLCMALCGRYDFLLTLETDDFEQAQAVFERLRRIAGVRESWFEVVKSTKFDRRTNVARVAPPPFRG
jgi:DNA-binding Lrp family transcriptional regulator